MYYSDNLDDLLAFDGIRSFTGGQASGLQSDLLAENQVQQLVNMTLSPKGSLETRRGLASFSTSATSQVGGIKQITPIGLGDLSIEEITAA